MNEKMHWIMRTNITRLVHIALLCVAALSGTAFNAVAQGLVAVNDTLRTGPLQKMRKNVIRNDSIPGDYVWSIVASSLPATSQGVITKEGDNIVFTPNLACRNTVFSIKYELRGSEMRDTAEIRMIVAGFNNPGNIIDPDIYCYHEMPENITFGIHRKFPIYSGSDAGSYTPPGGWIDGYTSPLVGDLTGDGKPEIVIAGNNSRQGNTFEVQSVNIYNGQTGALMYKYPINSSMATGGLGWNYFTLGQVYHRAPSIFALADLDNDGLGEIVICNSEYGYIAALKPVVNSNYEVTHLTVMWRGKDRNGNVMSYKAPLTTRSREVYGYPNPCIADIDADGSPEVIIYNKIFDGFTGRLVMSWRGAAMLPHYSAYGGSNENSEGADNTDLEAYNDSNPISASASSNIRRSAMTGRRPTNNDGYTDNYLAVPAIVDINGDGVLEIVTGSRIHFFNITNKTDHRSNLYTTIEGPAKVTVTEAGGAITHYLNDGYTRVADIDGDGELDIIVVCSGSQAHDNDKILVYVWNMSDPVEAKACISFGADTRHGCFSIPFVGDINGKRDGWDGSGWNRKLPEICILSGVVQIDRYNSYGNRTGILFHPKSDANLRRGAGAGGWDNNDRTSSNRRFNRNIGNSVEGHIIGLTWDASVSIAAVEDKLKLSWGMEHSDESNQTGLTLFDFDNNHTADLCYRDEKTLRVISPGKSGKDYVELSEAVGPGTSVMFSTPVYSGTAFEYPAIADVNMDGSADIVVTNIGITSNQYSGGWVEVYEYMGQKWAPCPPVWNQGMYDPTMVREDLKINSRPIPLTQSYTKNGEIIQPYNGSWMQVPIVRDESNYVPVVRKPDAIIIDMQVHVNNNNTTAVTLDIYNQGTASIAASAPVLFYNGGKGAGLPLSSSTIMHVEELGVDIFPNERKQVLFTLNNRYQEVLIWACIMVDRDVNLISGYDDCELSNNIFSGAYCPQFKYTVTASRDTVLCGTDDTILLTATAAHSESAPVYQWYRNDIPISGATSRTYSATLTGVYKCFIMDGTCRTFSNRRTLRRQEVLPAAPKMLPAGILPLCEGDSIRLTSSVTGKSAYRWYLDGKVIPGVTQAFHWVKAPGKYTLTYFDAPCYSQISDTAWILPASPYTMRWTGLRDTNWENPENWVEIVTRNGWIYESPVPWYPQACMDVVIAPDAPHYPELTHTAKCNFLTVKDRAMLKNPHVLQYDSVWVELTLKASERDRFIMWSAPLRDMYSGDYHFKNGTTPQWSDVYMNFFQQANPDGGMREKNAFTATFGHPDVSLGLGRAFNVKAISTSVSKDRTWIFPQPDNFYVDVSGTRYPATGNLVRSNSHRFITDGVVLAADTTFALPLPDNAGYNLVQVVNPYLAWLDVGKFLKGNANALLATAGYLIWNGSIDSDFTAVASVGNRYYMTKAFPDPAFSPNLIPPLQSFFVQKKSSNTQLASVKMSPNWTTTTAGNTPYTLRAEAVENGALRIHVSQGRRNSYALLRYDEQASAEYNGNEDIRTLFYDEVPLAVYSFTPLREPLAINASGSFGQQETALGLRVPEASTVKLEFTGMETFGHDVYLIDKARDNYRVDLQQMPEYTFTVTGQPVSRSGVIAIDDRFVLQMVYTGHGLVDVSGPDSPEIRCSGLDGHIHVRVVSGVIRRLEVYNVPGSLVYAASDGLPEYRIPAQTGVYLLKIQTGTGTVLTEKVIVR
jgi:hypothetical protein